MEYWVKNTKGEKSASLTMVIVAFIAIMFWMVLSVFVKPFGLEVMPFDASGAMMVLSPLLGLYWGRRNTDVQEAKTLSSNDSDS